MQGNRTLDQLGKPNVKANSAQSPIIWTRAPANPRLFPAQNSRSWSDGNHAFESCRWLGKTPDARATTHQWSHSKMQNNVHHPLQPHLQSCDLRIAQAKWRTPLATCCTKKPIAPSCVEYGTPSTYSVYPCTSPAVLVTTGCALYKRKGPQGGLPKPRGSQGVPSFGLS